ncbi:hypothetical protein B4098_2371 [Heyndrickxia coagulans]|uniref:Uncharacterized protein n=1 Tax=Heyndrickxia coagulans TaxID=1398 RepID=A0A150JNI6_HEYCO|nr:hypothetical protein B4098_2371 [Heyndrickxia coagulans]
MDGWQMQGGKGISHKEKKSAWQMPSIIGDFNFLWKRED